MLGGAYMKGLRQRQGFGQQVTMCVVGRIASEARAGSGVSTGLRFQTFDEGRAAIVTATPGHGPEL